MNNKQFFRGEELIYAGNGQAYFLYNEFNWDSPSDYRKLNDFVLTMTHLGNLRTYSLTKLKAKSLRILGGYRILKITDSTVHLRAVPCREHR